MGGGGSPWGWKGQQGGEGEVRGYLMNAFLDTVEISRISSHSICLIQNSHVERTQCFYIQDVKNILVDVRLGHLELPTCGLIAGFRDAHQQGKSSAKECMPVKFIHLDVRLRASQTLAFGLSLFPLKRYLVDSF